MLFQLCISIPLLLGFIFSLFLWQLHHMDNQWLWADASIRNVCYWVPQQLVRVEQDLNVISNLPVYFCRWLVEGWVILFFAFPTKTRGIQEEHKPREIQSVCCNRPAQRGQWDINIVQVIACLLTSWKWRRLIPKPLFWKGERARKLQKPVLLSGG